MVKHFFSFFTLGVLVASGFQPLAAATTPPIQDNVRYIGAVTCQSSMCHGGASPSRNQFTIWSRDDAHARAYATLTTGWGEMIAKNLAPKMASPETDERCTTCHAPLADVPPGHLASTATVTEGVSCEVCHGGAESWLRAHTRYDWTYGDRVQAGMRDMRSAFVRANTCVVCHQVIDPALIKAGHPELTFELDGQDASEPRHWLEKADWFGPKAWAVGQAVALREISRQLEKKADPDLIAQQNALLWLFSKLSFIEGPEKPSDTNAYYAAWANETAQSLSATDWKPQMTNDGFAVLAGMANEFTDNSIPLAERERLAERLVLGLDRLFKANHPQADAPGQAELTALFAAVHDRKQFNPQEFSSRLQKFADVVTAKK